ncbi:hypothetical protein DPMN_137934 [Dreissena polymorpha]|uniref:Uncharacterized protein n=1 Tax=Dreissena polymorpha TaxID=45954 RepID=A0A9D4G662_DREPO|nr:hypothetical protein DPMN_137934 [Dreissena polymorpha]
MQFKTLDILHGQLILKKDDFEESLKSLEQAYNTILEEIIALRKAINDSLHQLEKNTIKELDTLLAKLRTSIQIDNVNCNESIKKMTSFKEDWLNIKGKSEATQMIMYRKCLDMSFKTKAVLQEITENNDITLSFTPDPIILQTMATLSGLGQILIKDSREAKETKSKACCELSSKINPEIQAIETNNQDLDTIPVSGTPRQAKVANQTSTLNKLDTISNQAPVPHKQSDITNQSTAVNKSDYVPCPISNSPAQSDNALNKPGWMPHTVTSSSSTQLAQGYQASELDRSDPNQVIRVKESKKYKVEDAYNCFISGICETANGEFLLTDKRNLKVKLLDQTYKVVAQCDLPSRPMSICSIDSSLVAVAMDNKKIIFIKVANLQLLIDRTLEFQHLCNGIACHQGNLFITTDTALYQYTVDGRLVSKLYEDTRSGRTGNSYYMYIFILHGHTDKTNLS